MEFTLTFELFMLLLLVGGFAGFVDAIAGGGGILTIPALLWAGLSPTQALATNKLQGCAGTMSATLYFVRRKMVNLNQMKASIICTFIGAAAGTLLIQILNAEFIAHLIPILLIAISAFFLFSPAVGDQDRQQHISEYSFALAIGTAIGFYDGFFGPGTGSFFTIAFITLLGYSLPKATAHTKVLNMTSNIASLLFFIVGGHVVWVAGLTMALGQFVGARMGSKMVILKGSRLIKPLIITLSLTMTAKLLWQQYGLLLNEWLNVNIY